MVLVKPPPRHPDFSVRLNTDFCSVVISIFAILILSILGLLFRSNHHELVGGDDDPKDGPEVAATIFIAVLIYAVSRPSPPPIAHSKDFLALIANLIPIAGLPRFLRHTRPLAPATEPTRPDPPLRELRRANKTRMVYGVWDARPKTLHCTLWLSNSSISDSDFAASRLSLDVPQTAEDADIHLQHGRPPPRRERPCTIMKLEGCPRDSGRSMLEVCWDLKSC